MQGRSAAEESRSGGLQCHDGVRCGTVDTEASPHLRSCTDDTAPTPLLTAMRALAVQ